MKWLATGLLVLAGAIYVAAELFQAAHPWLFYVSVTAEASMVGAIADWFAVTALFHHPLGLRFIPHTAIIPRNKQRIASGLSHFIETNFLTNAAVLQRIRDFQPARTLYAWLLRAENAEAVATYVTRLSAYLLGAMDDERVRRYLQQTIARRLKSADIAGAAAELLDVLTENKRHHELLDAALAALDELLSRAETQAYLAGEVAKSAPLLKWLSDLFQLKLDERAALKIVEVAVQKIKEVRNTESHALRERFDAYAAGFVRRLKNDEALRERVHRLRDEALASPALAAYAGDVWDELRAWLAAEHDRRPASLHQRVPGMLIATPAIPTARRRAPNGSFYRAPGDVQPSPHSAGGRSAAYRPAGRCARRGSVLAQPLPAQALLRARLHVRGLLARVSHRLGRPDALPRAQLRAGRA